MAREDRPAFPWYVKDWFSSEDRPRMTYEARGIYRELLDYAWLHHGIPSNTKELAAWLGLAERKFALIWTMIAACWVERDGRLVNEKQERVRAEMNDFRQGRRDSGRLGGQRSGEARRAKQTKQNEAQLPDASRSDDEAPPSKTNPSSSSSIAFASSTAGEASPPPPLIRSPIEYAKARSRCTFVGARLEVPHKLHADLRRLLGGDDPDTKLLGWYAEVDAEIEVSREPIAPDVFPWLQKRYAAWAVNQQGADALEAFRKGA